MKPPDFDLDTGTDEGDSGPSGSAADTALPAPVLQASQTHAGDEQLPLLPVPGALRAKENQQTMR